MSAFIACGHVCMYICACVRASTQRARASSSVVNYTYGFHYWTSLLWNRKPRVSPGHRDASLATSNRYPSNSGDYQASFSDARRFSAKNASERVSRREIFANSARKLIKNSCLLIIHVCFLLINLNWDYLLRLIAWCEITFTRRKVPRGKKSIRGVTGENEGGDSSLHPLQSFNDDTLLPSLPNGRNSGYVTVT